MENNNYNYYIKKFKTALIIIGLSLLVFLVLFSKIIPQLKKIITIQSEFRTKTASLEDNERKIETLKEDAEKRAAESKSTVKAIFKPVSSAIDTESAISDEFAEILQVMRDNKIKARSIVYDYDPQDDNFVKNAATQYHVCRISAEMIGTYAEFENFLRNLYKHEHFLDISKIEVVPYQKNKRILLISFQIKLYALKQTVQ